MFLRQQRYYSKKSGYWLVCYVKEEKIYLYVSDIILFCIEKCLVDFIGMNRLVVLDVDDFRCIFKILVFVEFFLIVQFVEEKKLRFFVEKDIKFKD